MKITKHIKPSWTEWQNEKGELHREDGPALINNNGNKCWYQNGKYHRLDGPAIEYSDGYHIWYFNGKQNRFVSEKSLKLDLNGLLIAQNDIKFYIINTSKNLDPGEIFLLRLTIKNHFPDYLDFLDKLLILQ